MGSTNHNGYKVDFCIDMVFLTMPFVSKPNQINFDQESQFYEVYNLEYKEAQDRIQRSYIAVF